MLAIVIVLFSSAHAGKLAEGFRGLKFGPASVLDKPPQPQGCVRGDAGSPQGKGTAWDCVVEINGVAVEAGYIVESGWFYGVQITVPDNFLAARAVREALGAAYGTCVTKEYASGVLPDCTWTEGTSKAVWSYNQFSDASSVSIFDFATFANVEAARKAAAAAAAAGL